MASVPVPLMHETSTDAPTLHPSAQLNIANRYPELGPELAGFIGNTARVIEVEAPGHVFFTADEAEAFAVRLLQHATILRIG